jgi:hypothetical protein
MDRTELDVLLSKHRLTFNWREPAMEWWLVGQEENSNALKRTKPQPAANRDDAQLDALQYIKSHYK